MKKIKCPECGISVPDVPEDASYEETLCNNCHDRNESEKRTKMKKTLYYAEIYFNGHFSPWSVYRTGFKPDIPRMDSEHLFPSLKDLEDAILRAKDECADDTIDEIRRESVEVYTCRDCGMEFDHDEMRESGECDPCYRAAAMGPN